MTDGRQSVGIVVPPDFVLDDEYWALAGGATLHVTRLNADVDEVNWSAAEAVGDPDAVAAAARTILPAEPAAVIYACTAGSFIRGVAGEAALRRAMSAVGVTIPVTTSGAIVAALRALGVRRVAVATPYTSDLTDALAGYLEDSGHPVTGRASLETRRDIGDLGEEDAWRALTAADSPDAEAIVVSCTNLRTVAAIDRWEALVGKPVISANQATMWAVLRAGGAKTHHIPGILGKADQ